MNKRNTEGYVLAYVLIVVAVMGLIAAALMTSTLQVVKAQENSIEYMKDKYAVQGELERLVADLDYGQPISSLTGSGYNSEVLAIDAAVNAFASYLNDADTFNLDLYPLISERTENGITSKQFSAISMPETDSVRLSIVFSKNSAELNTSFSFMPDITITEVTHTIEDDLSTPEDESGSYTDFDYQVDGAASFVFSSYEISSTEVTPDA